MCTEQNLSGSPEKPCVHAADSPKDEQVVLFSFLSSGIILSRSYFLFLVLKLFAWMRAACSDKSCLTTALTLIKCWKNKIIFYLACNVKWSLCWIFCVCSLHGEPGSSPSPQHPPVFQRGGRRLHQETECPQATPQRWRRVSPRVPIR